MNIHTASALWRTRLARAALVAALVAGALTLVTPSPAHAATQLGTPNFTTYCKVNVGSVWYPVTQSLSSPYAWRCTNSYTRALVSIDVNKACRQQFGAGAYASVAYYSPYGWRCYR